MVSREFSHRHSLAKIRDLGNFKRRLGGGQETATLHPTGTIGDMVGQKGVTPFIDASQCVVARVNRHQERHHTSRAILEQRLQKSSQ